jgi:beta-glucosidase
MTAMFGGGDSGEGGIGMEMQGFMLEMPLLSLLEFQEGALPRPAVEIVDDLLKQVYAL